ncbi:MAG: uncharacterized protein QOH03_5290 [Kribbellaceae bacterium]|nr:uncharacterized protein [Kribbellaceae bacterium]
MRIIDVHGHWGPWPFHMDVADVALNLELMDRYGIERQIVSAAEAVVYDSVAGNAKLAEVLLEQPRLHGYAVVNANRLERSAQDLKDCLSTGRFVGAKIHTTYPGVPIGSPLMADAFDMLDEVGVPLLLHTWGTDVALLPGMLEKRPNLKVIAGHAGGDAWREAAKAAVECDRIYLEHCRTVTDAGRIGFARGIGVPMEQFLFGTDSTLIDPCVSLGVIRDAGFTEEELQQVLSSNAERLFKGLADNG